MIEYTVQVYEEWKEWYLNGKLHREDGPAVEYADGSKSWYLNGNFYETQGEWQLAKNREINTPYTLTSDREVVSVLNRQGGLCIGFSEEGNKAKNLQDAVAWILNWKDSQ